MSNAYKAAFFDFCLVAFSALFGLLVVEIGYRVHLSSFSPQLNVDTSHFIVWDSAFRQYDPVSSYRYVPNAQMNKAIIYDGLPQACLLTRSDGHGNIVTDSSVSSPSAIRIFTFGDSFTAESADEQKATTWPSLLAQRLNRRHDRAFEVTNYARGGIGLYQMVTFAAETLASSEHKPDVIVIAFIRDDLTRPIWWLVKTTPYDMYWTADRNGRLRNGNHLRFGFLDPRATNAWCKSVRDTAARDDPTLVSLRENYGKLRRRDEAAFGSVVNLWAADRSYLWSRLMTGDPFALTRPHFPRITVDTYRESREWRAAIERLKTSGTRVVFVHLPEFPDLKEGAYNFHFLDRPVYDLVQKSGIPLISALDAKLAASAEEYYQVPYDMHPSLAGIDYLARVIDEKLSDIVSSVLREEPNSSD